MSAPAASALDDRVVPPTHGRVAGRALLGIETKHLLRSILFGIGVVGAAVAAVRGSSGEWPTLTGADAIALRAGDFLGAFALLAGARLGLRDRRTGANELVGSTPTSTGKVHARRLLSLGIVGAAAFAVVFLTAIGYALSRGGHGTPDLRLLLDGALATGLASWVGYAIGTLSRSIVVSLFAAPVYGLMSSQGLAFQFNVHKAHASFQWITPTPNLPDRSVSFGFLPDIFWTHPLYLAGVAAFVAGVVVVATAEGGFARRLRSPAAAVAAAGLAVALGAGGLLLAKPDSYRPNGPGRSTWTALYDDNSALIAERRFRFDDDHLATACASGRVLTACVYPAYGEKMARLLVSSFEAPAELFRGLPGVPTRVRMIPADGRDCMTADGAMAFSETDIYFLTYPSTGLSAALVDCITTGSMYAAYDAAPTEAQDAVKLWFMLQTGLITRAQATAALANPDGQACTGSPSPQGGEDASTCYDVVAFDGIGGFTPAAVRAALAMYPLGAPRVIEGLRPVWTEMRAGRLPVSRLPGGGA